MKNQLRNPVKIMLLCASFLLVRELANGSTYTAVASGKWSSATTWGGTPPPFTLSSDIDITINAGITVTMDSDVTVNNVLALIDVVGTLSASANGKLTVSSGMVTGIGSIDASELILSAPGIFSFTGALTVDTLINSIVSLSTFSQITVNDKLILNNSIEFGTGGTLTMGANSNITISGGGIILSGGSLNLTAKYSVDYVSVNAITGMELSGSGLGSVTINVGVSNKVTLGMNLTTNDSLTIVSGTLMLNGYNLTVNGVVSSGGAGLIFSTYLSSISIGSLASIAGTLTFDVSGDTVKNLSINIGGGGSVKIGSNLVVNGMLQFSAGYLDIQDNNLSIGLGGTIAGANANSYIITSGSGSLIMNALVNDTTVFQVGTLTNYFPAAISLNNGSGTGTIGVNVSAGVYSKGITGIEISNYEPMVDATWLFQNNIGGSINANMKLSWEMATEVNGFTHGADYISHYESIWDNIGDSMGAMVSGNLYFVTRDNIVSMSPFTIFDNQTIPTSITPVAGNSAMFEIYPNPASDNLYVNNTGLTDAVYGEICDMLGQVVTTFQFKDSPGIIPVSTLPGGIYMIRVYTDNTSVVKKFIKL